MLIFLKLTLISFALQCVTVKSVPVREERRRGNTDRHNDCQLIFNVGQTVTGETKVTSITMPPLNELMTEQQVSQDDRAAVPSNVCNLVFSLQPSVVLHGQKRTKVPSAVETSDMLVTTVNPINELHYDIEESGKPIYEFQTVAWPSDVEDIVDALGEEAVEEQSTVTVQEEKPLQHEPTGNVPVLEDQMIIYPAVDFEEDFGETDAEDPSIHDEQKPKPTITPVSIVESFHKMHPNGTSEYKLVLSNGLINYKKIYNKTVDKKVITVQEGYDSVPIQGRENEFHTQHYIADERGYNVYSIS